MAASEVAAAAIPGDEKDLSLFHLERDLVALLELRDEMAANSEDTDAVDGEIGRYVQAQILKVDNIRSFLRHCEVMEAAAKEEANLQRARAQRWGDRAAVLKQACIVALEAVGKKSVEGRTGKLSVRGNGGKAPLDVYDQSKVPAKYEVVTVEVDRTKIREDLERGAEVPGARLLERGVHLHVL